MVIQGININHKNYPKQLREIAQPPAQLYIQGKLPDVPMVAIVGSRRPTNYGRQVTYQISYDCARAGLAVVSGLAVGLDTVAHEAALEAGGLTVAVQGCGLDRVYPSRNRELAERIVANGGAVISEYPVGTEVRRHHFIARNRIEAGLSQAVVVTEAAAKSGTLITANFALNENRLVMAVPGNITSLLSAGPNNLLRVGAIPVTGAVDVLNALNLDLDTLPEPQPSSEQEANVISMMLLGATTTEAMLEYSDFDAASLASILSLMEITGKIRNLGAGQWALRQPAGRDFDKR